MTFPAGYYLLCLHRIANTHNFWRLERQRSNGPVERLVMDSGLLWSAPAKRRDRIEPQPRGIPAALAGNPGPSVPPAPRRRRFPLAASPLLGTDAWSNPKRRQDRAT
ncbi:hypothetical protein [Candidatus Thiosymbion oneisti]|uniref:hypothetical protein n=1 Tax=Candidatus Thiosymbion oneisti TaxID=589554 RepID=UPI00105DAFAF|nr:hypothetical protein [Candidatus Thiosymbion oneisti]